MAAFTNRATLHYNGVTTVSNTVTGEIVGALAITKTALSAEYSAGDAVSYIITLTNSGTADMTGVSLTDDLGAYDYNTLTLVPLTYTEGSAKLFVNGVPQPDPAVTAGESLVISGITVTAGGSAVVAYSAKVNEYAPLAAGSTIVNTVSLTGAKIETEVSADETIGAADGPALDITKALCPASVSENGQITYTFTIANTGGTEAGADDDVVLSDIFSPVLTDITVTLDGAPLAVTTGYTYDSVTGEFATVPGVITVPAATFTQDETTGVWETTPGYAVLTVTGTV